LASYSWNGINRITEAYSSARAGSLLKGTDYSNHRLAASGIRPLQDGFGRGIRLSFLNTWEGKPALRQTYYLYEEKPYFFLEAALENPTTIATNWLVPL